MILEDASGLWEIKPRRRDRPTRPLYFRLGLGLRLVLAKCQIASAHRFLVSDYSENLQLLLTLQCEAPRNAPSKSLAFGHNVSSTKRA